MSIPCNKIGGRGSFTFGTTYYVPYEGGIDEACYVYRGFLEDRGHTFPADYDPPVNWNELYDVGWYHSDAEQLAQNYTRASLLREAEKAKSCGCEALYLDPGWEVAEGTTIWDEANLGTVPELIRDLNEDYGLQLGFRSILSTYKPYWEEKFLVRHPEDFVPEEKFYLDFWEPCLCDPDFRKEKMRRILAIASHGTRFIMLDEMDWRGPCYADNHGHSVPSDPLMHAEAVCELASEIRRSCPEMLVEVHDPVWPWHTSLYVPTYYRQNAGESGSYHENWGFEYMWNCIDDLKTGKALSLYYYNLSCSIPLYLHITMAADNDNCLFFWWAASTIRHLGIGGKTSHSSVETDFKLNLYDQEARFASYRKQMELYRKLKPYFVRGTFRGLAENVHLHTLTDHRGGVVTVFNVTDEPQTIEFSIPGQWLGCDEEPRLAGADGRWSEGVLHIWITLPPLHPRVIGIGECAGELSALSSFTQIDRPILDHP